MQGRDASRIPSLNQLDSTFKPRVLAIEVVTGALVLNRCVTERLCPIKVEQVDNLALAANAERLQVGSRHEVLVLVVSHPTRIICSLARSNSIFALNADQRFTLTRRKLG